MNELVDVQALYQQWRQGDKTRRERGVPCRGPGTDLRVGVVEAVGVLPGQLLKPLGGAAGLHVDAPLREVLLHLVAALVVKPAPTRAGGRVRARRRATCQMEALPAAVRGQAVMPTRVPCICPSISPPSGRKKTSPPLSRTSLPATATATATASPHACMLVPGASPSQHLVSPEHEMHVMGVHPLEDAGEFGGDVPAGHGRGTDGAASAMGGTALRASLDLPMAGANPSLGAPGRAAVHIDTQAVSPCITHTYIMSMQDLPCNERL